MGCCKIKEQVDYNLEVDLRGICENSFNDLSISSHHNFSSNNFPETATNFSLDLRGRSISNTYLSSFEQAFISFPRDFSKFSQVSKTIYLNTEETDPDGIREEYS